MPHLQRGFHAGQHPCRRYAFTATGIAGTDYIGQTCLVGVLWLRGERLEAGPEGCGANRRDRTAGVLREWGRL